jgi:hypothetical protein
MSQSGNAPSMSRLGQIQVKAPSRPSISKAQSQKSANSSIAKPNDPTHIQKLDSKLRALKTLEKKLTEEHSTLTQKNKGDKRTRVILGCYECMEKQDMIIETFLELIGSRPTLESELKEKLDKGPPRLRVPTREELKFE